MLNDHPFDLILCQTSFESDESNAFDLLKEIRTTSDVRFYLLSRGKHSVRQQIRQCLSGDPAASGWAGIYRPRDFSFQTVFTDDRKRCLAMRSEAHVLLRLYSAIRLKRSKGFATTDASSSQ